MLIIEKIILIFFLNLIFVPFGVNLAHPVAQSDTSDVMSRDDGWACPDDVVLGSQESRGDRTPGCGYSTIRSGVT